MTIEYETENFSIWDLERPKYISVKTIKNGPMHKLKEILDYW